jgi:hypothetical protein
MSNTSLKRLQIGNSTAGNNFVIRQPDTVNGTLRISNGNIGTTTDLVVITSAGYVLKPNIPAFYAYGGAGQTGTDYVVQFVSTMYNNGNYYNTSTYRFTAPIAGRYFFTFSAMAGTATYNRFGLRLNGALYGGQKFADAQQYERFSASWVVNMAVSDYADITSGISGNGDVHADYREFTGFLMG